MTLGTNPPAPCQNVVPMKADPSRRLPCERTAKACIEKRRDGSKMWVCHQCAERMSRRGWRVL